MFATLEETQQALLRLLSDVSINGTSLFVGGKKWSAQGFWDLDVDEYHGNDLIEEIQVDQMVSAPVSKGLFLD